MLRGNVFRSALLATLALAVTVAAAATVPAPSGTALAAGLALLVPTATAAGGSHRARHAAEVAAAAALTVGLLLGDHRQAGPQAALYVVAIFAVAEVVGARVATLRRIAITDPLTGLPDRRGLKEAAERSIAACRKAGRPLSVVHLDLDDFKAVNDNFGHAVGDRVLRDCAASWAARLGPTDTLARVGGDEFLLVLPGSDRAQAECLLEGLSAGSPTALSHGIAALEPDDDLDRCLLRADAALYEAKGRRVWTRGRGDRPGHLHLLRPDDRAHTARRASIN